MKSKVRVEASATIANFGPGYDTFGICLDGPLDILEIETVDQPGISLEVAEEGFSVPSDPRKNTASVSAMELMQQIGISIDAVGLRIRLMKGVRPGSGLGSSAASAVAGALGAAALFNVTDRKKLLRASSAAEGVSSAAAHLDNVAPCLYGGFTVILDHESYEVLRITPADIRIVVCLPDIVVETAEARKLVPSEVPTRTVVSHVGWASGIVHGIKTGDLALMSLCMRDELSVPFRKSLIRGFDMAKSAAMSAGALSFSICGSGPALFCLVGADHETIGDAIVEAFSRVNVEASYFVARPGEGARIIGSE